MKVGEQIKLRPSRFPLTTSIFYAVGQCRWFPHSPFKHLLVFFLAVTMMSFDWSLTVAIATTISVCPTEVPQHTAAVNISRDDVFLNVQHPISCNGKVIAWKVCYYLPASGMPVRRAAGDDDNGDNEEEGGVGNEEEGGTRNEEEGGARNEEEGGADNEEEGGADNEEEGGAWNEEEDGARNEEEDGARNEEEGSARNKEEGGTRNEEEGGEGNEQEGGAENEEEGGEERMYSVTVGMWRKEEGPLGIEQYGLRVSHNIMLNILDLSGQLPGFNCRTIPIQPNETFDTLEGDIVGFNTMDVTSSHNVLNLMANTSQNMPTEDWYVARRQRSEPCQYTSVSGLDLAVSCFGNDTFIRGYAMHVSVIVLVEHGKLL